MLWDEILTESKQTGLQPAQTLQEQLQKAVLALLSQQNVFYHIVFQGGTCLRLFYGNPRFSEDLDFVLRSTTTSFDLSVAMTKLTSSIQPFFPFLDKITIRSQKHENLLQRYILSTESKNTSQHVRLHIELAQVPSHLSTMNILSFPPLQPAVRIEPPQEILADKLLALGSRPYIKGRDLWDIYFLTKEKHVVPSWELVWKKTQDYHVTISAVQTQLHQVRSRLEQQGVELLTNELQRFLPPSVFTTYQDLFQNIITHVDQVIQSAEAKEHES